jgi:hypothetical protein
MGLSVCQSTRFPSAVADRHSWSRDKIRTSFGKFIGINVSPHELIEAFSATSCEYRKLTYIVRAKISAQYSAPASNIIRQ